MSQVKKLEELLKKLETSRSEVSKMAEGGFLGLTKYGSGIKAPVGGAKKPRGRPRLSGGAFLGTKADTMGENYGRVGFQAPVQKLGQKAIKVDMEDMEGGYLSGGMLSGGYMSGGVLSGGYMSGGADCNCGGRQGGRQGGRRGGVLSGGDYSGTIGGANPGMMGGMIGGKCGVCGYKKCRCGGSVGGSAKQVAKAKTNPWLIHLAKVRKANPHLKGDVVGLAKLAKESY